MTQSDAKLILLVEDDSTIRSLVASMLASSGYIVVQANDGADGLRRFCDLHGAVDLVLSDITMPTLTGSQMVQRIRAIEPSVRVVFMTGKISEANLSHGCLQTFSVLQKPFTTQTLIDAVAQSLRIRLKGAPESAPMR